MCTGRATRSVALDLTACSLWPPWSRAAGLLAPGVGIRPDAGASHRAGGARCRLLEHSRLCLGASGFPFLCSECRPLREPLLFSTPSGQAICTRAVRVRGAQALPSRQCTVMKHQPRLHTGRVTARTLLVLGGVHKRPGTPRLPPQHRARSGQTPKERTWLFPHSKHKPLTWSQAAHHGLQVPRPARVGRPLPPGFLRGGDRSQGPSTFRPSPGLH